MTRILLRAVTLAGALGLTTGCAGDEMAPYGRLASLRLLAIQSDPVAPAPGETTTLTPLLYVPEGQSAPELEWSWCPFPGSESDGYPCEFDPAELDRLSALGIPLEVPPLELGSGPTMSFTNSLAPELLMLLCSGPTELPPALACPHGFPVQLKVRVRTDEESLVAVRNLHLGFDPAAVPNGIPTLPGVELKVEEDWVAVSDDFRGPVRRDEVNDLRALVTEDQAEEFAVPSLDGELVTRRERLTISWFVESGRTRAQRTGFIEGVAPLSVLNENEWSPAREDDYEGDTSELVLVLRDEREGVSWWRHTFDIVEAP